MIMLVDDEELVIDVGRRMLNKLGYEVLTAASGEEALTVYPPNQDNIDAIILDMIMPTMGGGEVFDKLKEINPHVRVIISSGYGLDAPAQEILDRGGCGFIPKPFNLQDLSQTIHTVLINK
ncbi:MAG: response regulator [Desulfobacterales bacterium]|nr:MAG: response regulator [Desulfobacterales bacterium]